LGTGNDFSSISGISIRKLLATLPEQLSHVLAQSVIGCWSSRMSGFSAFGYGPPHQSQRLGTKAMLFLPVELVAAEVWLSPQDRCLAIATVRQNHRLIAVNAKAITLADVLPNVIDEPMPAVFAVPHVWHHDSFWSV
jgi:hypothetical protein